MKLHNFQNNVCLNCGVRNDIPGFNNYCYPWEWKSKVTSPITQPEHATLTVKKWITLQNIETRNNMGQLEISLESLLKHPLVFDEIARAEREKEKEFFDLWMSHTKPDNDVYRFLFDWDEKMKRYAPDKE